MADSKLVVQCIARLIDLGSQLESASGEVAFALRIALDSEQSLLYELCKGTAHETNPLFTRYMK